MKKVLCQDCGTKVSALNVKRCSACYHIWQKGKTKPLGFSDSLSKTRTGSGNPFYGKSHSCETREKWSEDRSGIKNRSYGKRGSDSPNFQDNNTNWRGGKTKLTAQIRGCAEYEEWRFKIFSRDNFKCATCGIGGALEAHHKIPFITLLEEFNIKTITDSLECSNLWYIDNGITLCINCHCEIDESRRRFIR